MIPIALWGIASIEALQFTVILSWELMAVSTGHLRRVAAFGNTTLILIKVLWWELALEARITLNGMAGVWHPAGSSILCQPMQHEFCRLIHGPN